MVKISCRWSITKFECEIGVISAKPLCITWGFVGTETGLASFIGKESRKAVMYSKVTYLALHSLVVSNGFGDTSKTLELLHSAKWHMVRHCIKASEGHGRSSNFPKIS